MAAKESEVMHQELEKAINVWPASTDLRSGTGEIHLIEKQIEFVM